jgi:regulator of PEP synthase PpsR (kinase-PPPase family)
VNASYFHLHLVSDATGETLIAVGRAVTAQYESVVAIEHVYPLVRTAVQLERVCRAIEDAPGVVLYTLVDQNLAERLEAHGRELGYPSLSVLAPVNALFQSYLGTASQARPGAQHVLNADYFKRIDAMNYTMLHDDGQHLDGLEEADVVLVGISRTSKTPTSIYLANRGLKTANVPLVPAIPPPEALDALVRPLVVGLVASPDRIVQIRQNRLLALRSETSADAYVDPDAVSAEVAFSRRYCARRNWPVIDVTRRSIEETAAAILRLIEQRRQQAPAS